jgi:hypothetical protein
MMKIADCSSYYLSVLLALISTKAGKFTDGLKGMRVTKIRPLGGRRIRMENQQGGGAWEGGGIEKGLEPYQLGAD